MSVWIDTSFGSYRAEPISGVSLFGVGTNLFVYSGNGSYQSGGYRITNAVSALTSNAKVIYPVSVRLVDDASPILIARWNSTGSAGGLLAGNVTTPTNKFVGIYACTVDRVLATDCSPNPSIFLAALTSAFSE